VASLITERVRIPTIGIGAGSGTDGQVLVVHDMLGLYQPAPRFVRQYARLGDEMMAAVEAYRADVEAGRFPAAEHAAEMSEKEWGALVATLDPAPSSPRGR
jgi:3-methyl-2-oxobutanoate hydroxymethyltransferase